MKDKRQPSRQPSDTNEGQTMPVKKRYAPAMRGIGVAAIVATIITATGGAALASKVASRDVVRQHRVVEACNFSDDTKCLRVFSTQSVNTAGSRLWAPTNAPLMAAEPSRAADVLLGASLGDSISLSGVVTGLYTVTPTCGTLTVHVQRLSGAVWTVCLTAR